MSLEHCTLFSHLKDQQVGTTVPLREPRQPIGSPGYDWVRELNSLFLAFRLIKDSVYHLQALTRSGADEHEAWNQTTVIHVQAAKVSLGSKGAPAGIVPALPLFPSPVWCPHFTSKAPVQGILIKGLNSKTILLVALRRKGNEAALLDLLQVVQIFSPRLKSRSSLPLVPQAILGCLIQFPPCFVLCISHSWLEDI